MPSVRIINGPNRDQVYPLKGGECVGRDPANAIQVVAAGVSRRHFQFEAENGQFFVTDLNSSNGTYVNTIRVGKHPLVENDQITVGGITLVYSKSDTGAVLASPQTTVPVVAPPTSPMIPAAPIGPPSRRLSFSSEDVPAGVIGGQGLKLAAQPALREAVVLKDDSAQETSAEDYSLDASVVFTTANEKLPQKDQVASLQKRLRLMFEISQALGATKDRDELLGKIMEYLFEIFPQADRGFILIGDSVDKLEPAVVRHRKQATSNEVQISRTIARKVYGEKQAILSQNAMEDDRFSGGLSILNFRILSMMVAPLLYREEVFGFIHLDTQDRVKKFTPDDLNLLAGLAVNAAIFLKNLKLFENVAKEERARATLERYFSPEVAKKLVSNELDLKLGGDIKAGTVFFSDIVGFTSMSESMEPAAVVNKINRYFKHMVDIVFKYNGSIDKFMGDAIMAIWGVPQPMKDEAVYAITAGVEMQNSVFLLNSEFIKEGEREIHMGIGLNSGHFIAGNMGSERRMEYTCIGDNVNLAQRVESKAGRGHVYVSESTFERADGKVLGVKLKATRVKGKAQPVTIYSVRGIAAVQARDAAKLYITSMPFQTGEGEDGILIKTKLLGDKLVLGLILLRDLPRGGERIEMNFMIPELPRFRVPIDLQGEVAIGALAGKCMKGIFSMQGTLLETMLNDLVVASDKTPEEIPRGSEKVPPSTAAEH